MKLAVASSKGGTGKTTFCVNLAYTLAERGDTVRLLDCDVEAPNDHLFIQPQFTEQAPVKVRKPKWDETRCTGCGECAEACHFNAIAVVKGRVMIFNELCHSCGVCAYVCPEQALTESATEIGHVQAAPENQPFFFAHGILNIAEAYSSGDSPNYKEITIISGKGGSGKTTVVSSLAMLADDNVLADNDVDAADLHLLLAPTVREAHAFIGGEKVMIDASRCTGCGECAEACHFGAIHCNEPLNDQGAAIYRIDELACEGCGMCQYVCNFDAVTTWPNVVGKWYVSDTDYGPMVHARLGIAEENSGRLVTQVRKVAADLAKKLKKKQILGDGPPGTGCPVIAAVGGTDQVLIVTEPTVSGVHDMQSVLDLTHHFGIPALIVINKADLNAQQTERIETIA